MERGKRTEFILRQFRRKTKRVVNKDLFTEFFYLNRNRRIIEFLKNEEDILVFEEFFKQFIPDEMKDFINIKIMNDMEEDINIWYYDSENLVIVVEVNWGFKKQEISIDANIENFCVSVIDDNGIVIRDVDYTMFNDYLISFATIQARTIAETFEKLGNSVNDRKSLQKSN